MLLTDGFIPNLAPFIMNDHRLKENIDKSVAKVPKLYTLQDNFSPSVCSEGKP